MLGAMLLDKEAVSIAVETLDKGDFYRDDHREAFEAMIDLFFSSTPVDIITVTDRLKARGTLDKVGGIEFLSSMAAYVPSISNARNYARIVRDKALLRSLIKVASDMSEQCYGEDLDAADILMKAQRTVFELSSEGRVKGVADFKAVLASTLEYISELHRNRGRLLGVPSGFKGLDEVTSGFQKSDLIYIAARPTVGKTAFALNIAMHAAVAEGIPVAIFNLEMTKEQLAMRMLCCEAMVDSMDIKHGRLTVGDWARISDSVHPLSRAKVFIDDTPGISVAEVRGKCLRLKLEQGIGLVVIDYLQLMQGSRRYEARHQEVSEMSRFLKMTAMELKVPIICLSQLNREPDKRSDKRPVLSDLKESGSIEQDADIVMFLYREDYYDQESDTKNVIEVNVAKNRNGAIGKLNLGWMPQYTKYTDIDIRFAGFDGSSVESELYEYDANGFMVRKELKP